MYHPVRWIGAGIRYWSHPLGLVFVNRRSSVQSGSPAPFFQELRETSQVRTCACAKFVLTDRPVSNASTPSRKLSG